MEFQVITQFDATGYAGQFSFNGATGSFSADSGKNLTDIYGSKEGYGSFDAHRMGDSDFNYNPHFSDITKAADLISLMTGSIAAIQQELDSE